MRNSQGIIKESVILDFHQAIIEANYTKLEEIFLTNPELDPDTLYSDNTTPLKELENKYNISTSKARIFYSSIKKRDPVAINACIKLLIKQGANINESNILLNALSNALINSNYEDIDFIIMHGKNVNWSYISSLKGVLSLDYLIKHNSLEKEKVIKILISQGADVTKGEFLKNIIQDGKVELLQFIHETVKDMSWNINIVDNFTPIIWAIRNNNSTMVKLLLSYGARIGSYHEKWKTLWEDEVEYNHFIYTTKYSINNSQLGSDYVKFDLNKENQVTLKKLLVKSYSALVDASQLAKIFNELSQNSVLNRIAKINSLNDKLTIMFLGLVSSYDPFVDCGGYVRDNRIIIGYSNINQVEKEILAHEMAHAMFFTLNNNSTYLPYINETQKKVFEEMIYNVLDALALYYIGVPSLEHLRYFDENYPISTYAYGKFLASIPKANINNTDPLVEKLAQSILVVYSKFYSNDEEHFEMIVRYPEALAVYQYEGNETVQKILAPFARYWQQIVDPKIDAFLKASETEIRAL